jgi:hypothetical protein
LTWFFPGFCTLNGIANLDILRELNEWFDYFIFYFNCIFYATFF